MNLLNLCSKLAHRIFSVLLLTSSLTWAALALAQERYTYSADRSEVTDIRTGLIWKRCSEGQELKVATKPEDDRCSGTASYYTHEQAFLLAKENDGWRLPNIKELSSLVDVSREKPTEPTEPIKPIKPTIDVKFFPETLAYPYWSSTPFVPDPSMAWSVYFSDGFVLSLSRGNYFHVRLVRM